MILLEHGTWSLEIGTKGVYIVIQNTNSSDQITSQLIAEPDLVQQHKTTLQGESVTVWSLPADRRDLYHQIIVANMEVETIYTALRMCFTGDSWVYTEFLTQFSNKELKYCSYNIQFTKVAKTDKISAYDCKDKPCGCLLQLLSICTRIHYMIDG